MMRWDVDVVHLRTHLPRLLHSLQRAAPVLSPSAAPELVERRLSVVTAQVLRNQMRLYKTCRPKSARCQHIWRAWKKNEISTLPRYLSQSQSSSTDHAYPFIRLTQLRDIEILVQQQMEVLEAAGKDDETLREIQKILYSTEVCTLIMVVDRLLIAPHNRTDSRCQMLLHRLTKRRPFSLPGILDSF